MSKEDEYDYLFKGRALYYMPREPRTAGRNALPRRRMDRGNEARPLSRALRCYID